MPLLYQGDLVKVPTQTEPVVEVDTTGRAPQITGVIKRTWFQFLQALYARGFWTPVAFAAGNFTGNGAMTWTLTSADQVNLAYTFIGKTMLVKWSLDTTSVGGVADTTLRITLPAMKTAATEAWNLFWYSDNGGAGTAGMASVAAGGTVIRLQKLTAANWTAAANTTVVRGQLSLEIQG